MLVRVKQSLHPLMMPRLPPPKVARLEYPQRQRQQQ
tara:strand:+ start:76 stop:183 length:108 start_codon:yes stop_codon:yes gene_type:complete